MRAPPRSFDKGLLDSRELEAVLDALPEAVTVRDRDDRFVYANPAARDRYGLAHEEVLIGRGFQEMAARIDGYDERGQPISSSEFPTVRTLADGVIPEPMLMRTVRRDTGETRWSIVHIHPLRDGDGSVSAAVTIVEDATARRTAEVHTQVLAESGRLLAASLDYEQTLRNAAAAALPALADWCLVQLVTDGIRQPMTVAHVDPGQRGVVRRLEELEGGAPAADSALARVLSTGASELMLDVTDRDLRQLAGSDEHLELLRALEIRCVIIAPLLVSSRITGAMSFFTSISARRFTAADLALAEQLARRAAVVVENARLHTTIADVAQTLQRSLLPAPLPTVAGWEIAALWRPALTEARIEIGGDFYEVFDTDGAAFVVIGDVTGHGVQAATITSLLRHGARFASHLEPHPVAIVRRLDEELRRRNDGAMATALCASIGNGGLVVCSAGHPPALIAGPGRSVREAPSSGPLLGAFADGSWHQERVAVAEDECVLFYTDGVTEAQGATDRFETGRLRRFLSAHAELAPQPLLDALEVELDRFRGGDATDDVAAIALRPRP